MPSVAMSHDIDPRQEIMSRVGDLSGVEIFGSDILVAIYKRPEKTKSGIILADSTRQEDVWQGKVMLVLKMGPTAYISEETGRKIRNIDVGDWIVCRASDGWALNINTMKSGISRDDTIECRIVPDTAIRARVKDPDSIY